ncbi:CD82 antigen-like [Anthonomus grandis grandis]|uniref:CD82 antigen-like n=1 Tax=Anthonomus grandis grandis TaxID=2921223 RepID=UPI002166B7A2|nr:CD82 antigen-like [Anthonomus grandis grandis]
MGCYSCMKFLYIILNVLFLLIGICGVGVIVWILTDQSVPLHFTQEYDDFMIATIIYLIVALALIVLSFLGIYSVCKEVKWALVVSFCLLLLIIVVQVASGVWLYINREALDNFTRAHFKNTIQEQYDKNPKMRPIVDTIQEKMKCCGADSPTDWSRNKEINLQVNSKSATYNIPPSCCREGILESQCHAATKDIKLGGVPNTDVIYPKGCYVLIKEHIIDSMTIIFAVFGVIVGVKVLGLLTGIILAFSMNRSNRYKA